MICASKFQAGDKVKVVKSTERILQASCIGMTGEVVETRSKDCMVKFADGSLHAIFEDDMGVYRQMCKAQEYKKLQEQGMTISEIAREYRVSRQCVSEALINYHSPKRNFCGAKSVRYPAIKKWLQDHNCGFSDFEKQCGCCLRKGLTQGKGMRKFTIDAILRVTGLTYEQAFAQ